MPPDNPLQPAAGLITCGSGREDEHGIGQRHSLVATREPSCDVRVGSGRYHRRVDLRRAGVRFLVFAGTVRLQPDQPSDGALLVFRAGSADIVDRFAASDPYVTNGLVARWRVRPWTVIVGGDPA